MTMDSLQFRAEHDTTWQRLDHLVGRGGRSLKRLESSEVEELLDLYQRTTTHLSIARSRFDDPALVQMLSQRVARAHALVYGSRPPTVRGLRLAVTETFPAALWHLRLHVALSALAFLLPAFVVGAWIGNSPAALQASGPEAVREAYVQEDFEDYYSADPSAQFAADVTTNNIQVGLLAFATGVVLALPTAAVLILNGVNVGIAGGLFAAVNELPRFFGLILPHGLLELTAVFIAGGTGMALGWTLIAPGEATRADAMVTQGRRAVVVVLGLVVVFAVAGLIEGFVTGSALPTWARVGIGLIVELVFLAFVAIQGRAAARRGLTGAFGERRAGHEPRPAELTAVRSP